MPPETPALSGMAWPSFSTTGRISCLSFPVLFVSCSDVKRSVSAWTFGMRASRWFVRSAMRLRVSSKMSPRKPRTRPW
jgi:hypothetical protein